MLTVKDIQRFVEIAQERFCNRRDEYLRPVEEYVAAEVPE